MARIEPVNRRTSYFNSKPYIFVKKIIQRFLLQLRGGPAILTSTLKGEVQEILQFIQHLMQYVVL